MNFLYLFINFAKIGLFSVGGGLATLPFLFELADSSANSEGVQWLTRGMVADMLAVAQSAPGAIGVNLAAYTGFRYAWIPGGFAAAFSLMIPSIIVITIVARVLDAFSGSITVKNIFSGLRPAAAGLLSAAGFGAISISLWNSAAANWYEFLKWKEFLIFAALFVLVYKFKKHPIIYIAAAGVIGVVLKL